MSIHGISIYLLQLCGYELEIDFQAEAAEVLSVLKQVKDIDVSTERLLKSVLELSQNRWGRTEAGMHYNRFNLMANE